MSRIRLMLVVVAIALQAMTAGRAHGREPGPWNFVVILVDDLGWNDLSCQGSRFYKTPHIDRLAGQGTRFTQGYAAASICSPTRAALLTGRSPARLGITDWIRAGFQRAPGESTTPDPNRYVGGPASKLLCPANPYRLELSELTIAELLKSRGYSTGYIGKWHLGDEGWYPEQQGFDINRGGCDYGQPPSYFDPYSNNRLPGIPTLAARKKGEFLTDREADEAAKFIADHKAGRFYLQIAPYAVHTPLMAKPEVIEKYKGKGVGEQKNAVYAGLVESVDDLVGSVLKSLDGAGIADRTIVVFTSDNGGLVGPTHNGPLRSGKGYAYEGGLRVPWIIRWPGVTPAGTISDQMITSVDLFPTVAEIAGIPIPDQPTLDGRSQAPYLRAPKNQPTDRSLVWHFPHYRHAPGPYSILRQGDWKLIYYWEGPARELYNLKDDPAESKDLAKDQEARIGAMSESLMKELQSMGARLPRSNPSYKPSGK
ncbi:MAG: sulfatase [Gemmataceae bacterium]|nr:sulfatase [Gemmataceae bacterium]